MANELCDICGKEIVPNVDAVHGGCDTPRHWDCHVNKHGAPDPFGLRKIRELKEEAAALDARMQRNFADLRNALGKHRAADDDFDKLDRPEFTKKRY